MSGQTLDELTHPEMLTSDKIMEILKSMNVPVPSEAARDKNALVNLCYKHIVPRPQRQPRGEKNKEKDASVTRKAVSLVRSTGSGMARTVATATKSESTAFTAQKRSSLPENDLSNCADEQVTAPPVKKVTPVRLKRNVALHAAVHHSGSPQELKVHAETTVSPVPNLRENELNATSAPSSTTLKRAQSSGENGTAMLGLTKPKDNLSPVQLKRPIHTVTSSEKDPAKSDNSAVATPTPAKKKIKPIAWP